MLITNNKRFQITTAKSVLSNNGATYSLDNNEFFSTVTFTKRLRSCRSKRIHKSKDDNKLFDSVTLTKCLYGHRNKHVSKDSKDSDLKN